MYDEHTVCGNLQYLIICDRVQLRGVLSYTGRTGGAGSRLRGAPTEVEAALDFAANRDSLDPVSSFPAFPPSAFGASAQYLSVHGDGLYREMRSWN